MEEFQGEIKCSDMFANQATVLPTIFKIPAYLFMILLLPSFWGRLLPTWVPGHPSTFWCHARHILLAMTYCQLNQLSAEEDELIRSLRQVKEQYSHILSFILYPNENVLTSGLSKRKKIFIWNFFYDMWKTHRTWKSELETFHNALEFPVNRSFVVRRFFKPCFFACLLDFGEGMILCGPRKLLVSSTNETYNLKCILIPFPRLYFQKSKYFP